MQTDMQRKFLLVVNFYISQDQYIYWFSLFFYKRDFMDSVLHGSVVRCSTRNPGVQAALDPLGFFYGSVLGQDTSEP